ncbi:MAG: tetratricopeptide repeat protein [Eubacteriales bacterium]
MICPKCGKKINNDYYCTNCDMEIKFYKKIILTSKWLYNQGLQKAKVRDLSGAIDYLKRSLKFNKENIEARNLLGLIYFEIGEVVLALEQWIVSKNIDIENNSAEEYINDVRNNQHQFDRLNTAIKKYNQSLTYVHQNSQDLAIIQLKKVLSLNPKFIKAYCLLTLLYIENQEIEKAKKTILKVLAIDKNNYTALRYYDMLIEETDLPPEAELFPLEENKEYSKFRKLISNNAAYIYQIAYIIVGLAIGAAIVAFLIMPNQLNNKNKTINNLKEEHRIVLDEKESIITNLNSEIEDLSIELEESTSELDLYLDKDAYYNAIERLQDAVNQYLLGDRIATADALYLVNEEALDESMISLNIYSTLKEDTYTYAVNEYYHSGYSDYSSGDFRECINKMTHILNLQPDGNRANDAIYFLARSHQRLGEDDKALQYFDRLIEEFPDTDRAIDGDYYRSQITD